MVKQICVSRGSLFWIISLSHSTFFMHFPISYNNLYTFARNCAHPTGAFYNYELCGQEQVRDSKSQSAATLVCTNRLGFADYARFSAIWWFPKTGVALVFILARMFPQKLSSLGYPHGHGKPQLSWAPVGALPRDPGRLTRLRGVGTRRRRDQRACPGAGSVDSRGPDVEKKMLRKMCPFKSK